MKLSVPSQETLELRYPDSLTPFPCLHAKAVYRLYSEEKKTFLVLPVCEVIACTQEFVAM